MLYAIYHLQRLIKPQLVICNDQQNHTIRKHTSEEPRHWRGGAKPLRPPRIMSHVLWGYPLTPQTQPTTSIGSILTLPKLHLATYKILFIFKAKVKFISEPEQGFLHCTCQNTTKIIVLAPTILNSMHIAFVWTKNAMICKKYFKTIVDFSLVYSKISFYRQNTKYLPFLIHREQWHFFACNIFLKMNIFFPNTFTQWAPESPPINH